MDLLNIAYNLRATVFKDISNYLINVNPEIYNNILMGVFAVVSIVVVVYSYMEIKK